MRTVSGLARSVQRLVARRRAVRTPLPPVRLLAAGRRPLIADRVGPQRHGGAVLDQVDGTTCGSAVLVALAAWAEPAELARIDGIAGRAAAGTAAAASVGLGVGSGVGFGARYDVRQLQVHRESTTFWPAALGTSPWGMVAWLRRHAPGAGPYRVRLVDDASVPDISAAIAAVDAALAAGRPVPLLIGTFVPRHYVMAVGAGPAGWRVYEPTSGEVREVPRDLVRGRATAALLGFDRLHALLRPS